MSELALTTEGQTHIVVKRRFEASPEAVYRAHLDPELIQQWCLGPEGWTMPVCVNEGKPGGKMRYEWSNGQGVGFFLTGEILELDASSRIAVVANHEINDRAAARGRHRDPLPRPDQLGEVGSGIVQILFGAVLADKVLGRPTHRG